MRRTPVNLSELSAGFHHLAGEPHRFNFHSFTVCFSLLDQQYFKGQLFLFLFVFFKL